MSTDDKKSRADIERTLAEVARFAKRRGAEFGVVAFSQLADMPAQQVDLVGLLVGERGALTRQAAKAAARAFQDAVHAYPGAAIAIIVSGYDTEPRELCDIKESRVHLVRFARLCGWRSVKQAMASPLHPHSVGLLAKCGAWPDEIHPDDVCVIGPPSTAHH